MVPDNSQDSDCGKYVINPNQNIETGTDDIDQKAVEYDGVSCEKSEFVLHCLLEAGEVGGQRPNQKKNDEPIPMLIFQIFFY